jgi:hypothetical protein
VIESLTAALAAPCAATAIRSRGDHVYAARNVIDLWPAAADIWRRAPLVELLEKILGHRFGLVRGLYFDKPPDQTWGLPWHKDMTIAVRAHRDPPAPFDKPTVKADVPHVEATRELLDDMLTARIHLDDVTHSNGPLGVIAGSHHSGKAMNVDESAGRSILARRGDVLLIRPLVAHNSIPSLPGAGAHRRILHLEFAASPELPGGYAWHRFLAGK